MRSPREQLYGLQDEVLGEIRGARAGLHLTGGTALSRGYYQHRDSEDLADIFWLCCRDQLDPLVAIEQTGGKAAGVFPPVIAKALAEGLSAGVPKVAWRQAPSGAEFQSGLESLVRRIVQ